MHWFAQAPANIALIKYMGKKDENSNLPDNSSLSYTLSNLLSSVKLEKLPTKKTFGNHLLFLEHQNLTCQLKRKNGLLIT